MASPDHPDIVLDENGGDVWEFSPSYPEKLQPPDPAPRMLSIPPPLPSLPSLPSEVSKGSGTLLGVFLPCVQSIIGIVFFSRFPFITGQAGVALTLLMLATCSMVTVLTALSMSAIATNGKVPAGGAYYMLARSLGPAFGGSIGVLYYLGLTSAASIYIIGAVETLLTNTSFAILSEAFDARFLGLLAVFGLWLINFVGTRYMSRVSIVLLGMLLVALVSMLVGVLTATARTEDLPKGVSGLSGSRLISNFPSDFHGSHTFNSVTAIFFPAMTGILAGCDRSGSLRHASRSIPKGTLTAIFATSGVYALFILMFGAVADRPALQGKDGLSAWVAWPWPDLVTACIIFNTVGEALQKTASAPPILFAIAQDDLLPLSLFHSKPDRSLLLTSILSAFFILIGDFDQIAPLVTMFFLMFYGCINVACCLLSVLNNPSWRPLWPYYHWATALAGAVLCFTVMVLISCYIDVKAQAKNWGDGLAGLAQERAKQALLGVDPKQALHVKNWKPQVLILGSLAEDGTPRETGLISLVKQLKKSNGLSIFGACRVAEHNKENFKKTKEDKLRLHDYFRQKQLEVFSNVVLASTARKGLQALIQAAGLGGLEPNTVLLPWPETWASQPLSASRFCKLVHLSQNCGMAVITLKPVASFAEVEHLHGYIDIWWFCYDGGLMCLLAYLLQKDKHWKMTSVRVIAVLPESEEQLIREMPGKIYDWVAKYRIFSRVECLVVTVPKAALRQFNQSFSAESRRKGAERETIVEELERADRAKVVGEEERELPDAAEIINSKMLDVSHDSSLIITILPDQLLSQQPDHYLRFCDCMVRGLPRVMMVKATDDSVVTEYT